MMHFITRTVTILFVLSVCSVCAAEAKAPAKDKKPLKVFILSGQSNMVGPAAITTFPHIGMEPKTAPMLKKMLGPDGNPRVMDDVYIASLLLDDFKEETMGKLTVGYASTKGGKRIGPEFTFGIYMHEALQEPILLIKPAWGGKSLNYHFRPPSAGEWTPPPGHPDLMVTEEEKPAPLPVPEKINLPIGYKPGKDYLSPYVRLPGFYLFKGLRGCEIGEHNGVHPIYICQDIKLDVEDFPLKKGDLIVALNGEGLPENPKHFWRNLVYKETMKKLDWTITVDRWRDGKMDTVSIDLAEYSLPGGKADIPAKLEEDKRRAAERKKNTGSHYHLMMSYIEKVLGDINRVYPDYDPKQGYELAGFVWFQGWNDMVDSGAYPSIDKPRRYEQYSWLLRHFIRDVRKDLNAPELPFVIGVFGIGGKNESYKYFRDAQAAPASDPEFKGTVKAVQTADYWDEQLDRLCKIAGEVGQKRKELIAEKGLKGKALDKAVAEYEETVWTPEEKAIQAAGASNAGFHYLGSSKMMGQFGKAFAEAMVELLDGEKAGDRD